MKTKNFDKRGEIDKSILVQIIFITLIMAMFLSITASKINGRGVRQDILENQIAMLIEAAESGMSFEISELNANGIIDDIRIKEGKVFVYVDGLVSASGQSYFSQYEVKVLKEEDKFRIIIS
jgi:hypothetical protein